MLLDFIDDTLNLPRGCSVLYLGGGCFWGVEKLFSSFEGVESTTTGYANGREDIVPDYKRVCKGDTEYIETVRIVYKSPANLTALTEALFSVIDLTAKNRQGADRGTQYQAAVFYADDKGKEEGSALFEKYRKSVQNFSVLFAPIKTFYKAEDYHQKYLERNPLGYCHINREEILHAKEKYIELIKRK